jgi:hypothetical protein
MDERPTPSHPAPAVGENPGRRGVPPHDQSASSSWSNGFYATEPHQPTYRPASPPNPAVEYDRGSLLDLGPPRPTQGGSADDDGADARPRALVAAAGLAVLVLLAAGTILAASLLHDDHHGASAAGSSASSTARAATSVSPAPAGVRSPAQVVASSIDTAITRSVAARKLIGPANNRTGACRATTADVRALTSAAATRSNLVTGLAGLNAQALVGGAAVVADLRQAWTYSARADRAYAAWAGHHLSCSGHAATHGNADWDRAHHDDTLSSAAKARAVKHWNPLARRYHLAARAAGSI